MVQHNHHSGLQTILDQSFGGKNGKSIILDDNENLLEQYLSEGRPDQTTVDDENLTTGDRAMSEIDGGEGITTAENSNILDEMYEVCGSHIASFLYPAFLGVGLLIVVNDLQDPERPTWPQDGPGQEMRTIQQRRHTVHSQSESRANHGRIDWSLTSNNPRTRGHQVRDCCRNPALGYVKVLILLFCFQEKFLF